MSPHPSRRSPATADSSRHPRGDESRGAGATPVVPSSCDASPAGETDASRVDERLCGWCEVPLSAARPTAKFCSKNCRQSAWRFAKHKVVAAAAARPLRLAYADPPYPGKAHLYRDHPDYGGEVDHEELLLRLKDYDGWALSTSSLGLRVVLPLCVDLGIPCRVASWHRGPRKVKSIGPWLGWEPVVFSSARQVSPPGVSDTLNFVSRPRLSDPRRVIGQKPAAFCFWMFTLLGARGGDQLADLYPGSGGVARAWRVFEEASREYSATREGQ